MRSRKIFSIGKPLLLREPLLMAITIGHNYNALSAHLGAKKKCQGPLLAARDGGPLGL